MFISVINRADGVQARARLDLAEYHGPMFDNTQCVSFSSPIMDIDGNPAAGHVVFTMSPADRDSEALKSLARWILGE